MIAQLHLEARGYLENRILQRIAFGPLVEQSFLNHILEHRASKENCLKIRSGLALSGDQARIDAYGRGLFPGCLACFCFERACQMPDTSQIVGTDLRQRGA